jgi:hypothetical protein
LFLRKTHSKEKKTLVYSKKHLIQKISTIVTNKISE